MAPVIRALADTPGITSRVCVTAQHREMLDSVLDLFDIIPDHDLDLMTKGQTLEGLTASILTEFQSVLKSEAPDLVLVHGDTATAFAATLGAYYQRIPVGHVEAGLRTGDIYSPWPEEVNRKLIASIAYLHFAPTKSARRNLAAEGVPAARIVVTGNTVIDALQHVHATLASNTALSRLLDSELGLVGTRRYILVTGHRRENFGAGFSNICAALREIAAEPNVEIIYPVHPNPKVSAPMRAALANAANIRLIAPQDYLPFVHLMSRAEVILTDSGGIQEEAPSLGKPVLVMRDCTERPEAIAAGTVRLVGTDKERIVSATRTLLRDRADYDRMSRAHNPYGDGDAAARIVEAIQLRAGHQTFLKAS